MFTLRLSRTTIGIILIAVLVLVVLLLSSVSVGGAAGAPQPNPPPKKGEEKQNVAEVALDVKAQLQDNDPVDPVQNEPCKTYMVKLKKGKTYVIDMTSADFDSYLRLEDGKGKQLAEDDDSGGDLDAQILFTPESDDTYKVFATRFAGSGAGKFTLKVQTLSYKAGPALALKQGELKVTDTLTNNDPTDPLGPKFRFKLYTVKMRAGKTYTIDMASGDFDTFLRLIDGQFRKLAEDDDTGGGANGTDSRIVFTPKADGEYHIVATSFDGGTGDYALTVRETD